MSFHIVEQVENKLIAFKSKAIELTRARVEPTLGSKLTAAIETDPAPAFATMNDVDPNALLPNGRTLMTLTLEMLNKRLCATIDSRTGSIKEEDKPLADRDRLLANQRVYNRLIQNMRHAQGLKIPDLAINLTDPDQAGHAFTSDRDVLKRYFQSDAKSLNPVKLYDSNYEKEGVIVLDRPDYFDASKPSSPAPAPSTSTSRGYGTHRR